VKYAVPPSVEASAITKAGRPLSQAHRQLIELLAQIAVEQYLGELEAHNVSEADEPDTASQRVQGVKS